MLDKPEDDNYIILECKNCNGSGVCWKDREVRPVNYHGRFKELVKCPVCDGIGNITITDANVIQKRYKTRDETVEDAKKICLYINGAELSF